MLKKISVVLAFLAFASPSFAQVAMSRNGGGSGSSGSSTITNGVTATSGCVAGGVLRSISNLVECGAGITYIAPTLKINSAATAGSQILDLRSTAASPVHMTIFSTSNNGYGTFSSVSGTGAAGGDVFGLGYASNLGGPSYPLKWGDFGGVIITGTTAAGVPLTINNSTNAVSPLVVQDNGTPVLTVADGGATTFTQQIINTRDGRIATPNLLFGTTGVGRIWQNNSTTLMGMSAGSATNTALVISDVGATYPGTFLPAGSLHWWLSNTGGDNTVTASPDTALGRDAAASIQMGVDVNGAAVNQTFKAHDGITGTDISGANLTIAAGRGTGAGAGGTLIFQTAPVGSTGTTAQTLATVLTLPKSGGLQVATGTKPACEAATRGTLYYVAGGAGVADTYEACRKDAGDAYAWVAIY